MARDEVASCGALVVILIAVVLFMGMFRGFTGGTPPPKKTSLRPSGLGSVMILALILGVVVMILLASNSDQIQQSASSATSSDTFFLIIALFFVLLLCYFKGIF